MSGRRFVALATGLGALVGCTGAWAGAGVAQAGTTPPRRAIVVFLDAAGTAPPAAPGMSVGLVSAAEQVGYARAQFLLDASQGARVGAPAYATARPPVLALAGGAIAGWPAARARAAAVAGRLQPGLLAASVPGGGAYAGPPGQADVDAVLAAGADGRIAAVALGGPRDVLARIAALQRRASLVVADLPPGAQGRADLARLAAARPPSELLVALQRTAAGGELLWCGVAGLPGATGKLRTPGELESASTEQRGLISAVDLAPTILAALGVHAPSAMEGRTIVARGHLDGGALRSLRALRARLQAIPGRRLPALAALLGAWAALVLACSLVSARARASALRAGALGLLWAPCAALAGAALQPAPGAEYALIAAVALALGAASDRALRWPRALAAPALAVAAAIALDALAGSQLQMRSLAGPDPAGGARFFGIGNELKSALVAMALLGVAGALYPAVRERGPAAGKPGPTPGEPGAAAGEPGPAAGVRRPRYEPRAAATLAVCGVALLVVEGWARIGAGVGGAVIVSAGFAVAATLFLRPPRRTRLRAGAVALAAVPAGLALLVALDLATARGRGHLQGTVLDARSLADLRDELATRYATAWRALADPAMAAATGAAAVVGAAGLRLRGGLLGPVGGDRLFAAAFAGGLAGGVCGALVEDSGPLLLVEAVLVLAFAAAYLRALPPSRPEAPGADGESGEHAGPSSEPRAGRPAYASSAAAAGPSARGAPSVDLPAPLAPSSATDSPRAMLIETSRHTVRAPIAAAAPASSIAGASLL